MVQTISVKLDDDVTAALDARRGDEGRSSFIRGLVVASLGMKVRLAPVKAVPAVSAMDRVKGHPLLSRVYGAVVEKPGTVRDVAGRLGIDVATVERAEAQLSKLGVVHYPARGGMEAV